MEIRGYLLIATLIGILWFLRSDHLLDDDGNPTAKPVSWSWACLVVAIFFFVEFLAKLSDPFYQRHPENYYAMWAFIGLGLLAFVFMRRSHVTISRGKVIEHLPPFWRKEVPITELCEVGDEGALFVLRSLDRRKIGVPKAYSGATGLIDELRNSRPDLFKASGP